jgi:hypothetical protein
MTPENQAELEQRIRELTQQLHLQAEPLLEQMVRLLMNAAPADLLNSTQFQLRDLVAQLGLRANQLVVDEKKKTLENHPGVCPTCERRYSFHAGNRKRSLLHFGGELELTRDYYRCVSCGSGRCPLDEVLDVSKARCTPMVEQLIALCGTVADGFGEACDILQRTTGLRVSENTMLNHTEAAGDDLAERLAEGEVFGEAKDWSFFRDAEGKTLAVVSIDATGVPQQGDGGAKAEGRSAYVGMIYNPQPSDDHRGVKQPKSSGPMKARYLSGHFELNEVGELMRRQGAQVGLDRVEVQVGICDGGAGLAEMLQRMFPLVKTVILDYWHASEYLHDLAKAAHPSDEAQAQVLGRHWSERLKTHGGATVLEELEKWIPPNRTSGMKEAYAKTLSYFRNQKHRMDYPTYEKKGWPIGSGAVESACKMVVNQRLKAGGMRWKESGSHAMCHLRALYRSEKGQWDAFWKLPRHRLRTI